MSPESSGGHCFFKHGFEYSNTHWNVNCERLTFARDAEHTRCLVPPCFVHAVPSACDTLPSTPFAKCRHPFFKICSNITFSVKTFLNLPMTLPNSNGSFYLWDPNFRRLSASNPYLVLFLAAWISMQDISLLEEATLHGDEGCLTPNPDPVFSVVEMR